MNKVKLSDVKNMKGNTNWAHLKTSNDEPKYSFDTPEIKQYQLNEMKRIKDK
ncbi:hypothetical protein [Pseudoalteromonas sp. B62]|jgi:hypothetical protein|uniref:hypothetical protein n=1 Tax=Pseudoalteromonas sp. B62 TaxID=630483 RepID=UPI00301DE859